MRCYVCNQVVTGIQGMTDPNHGAVHITCYEVKQAMARNFKGININALTDNELTNLQDLVLAEVNERKGDHDDDIELF